jgi:hypothetical protein
LRSFEERLFKHKIITFSLKYQYSAWVSEILGVWDWAGILTFKVGYAHEYI